MATFLINNGSKHTYEQLINDINREHWYYPLYKESNLYLYFSNLIKALISDSPLILLDADLNPAEIDGIDEESVNRVHSLEMEPIYSPDEIVKRLMNSSSKITIFTSGTTGQPKNVTHNVQTLSRSVRTSERYKSQVWGFAYNPTHMAGLQVFFQAIANLNTLVNVFNKSRKEVYEAISDHKITHLSATPTFYRLLLPFDKQYPSVERVTLGGEKSDEKLYSKIKDIFPSAKINNIYASTEAGTLFAAKGDAFQIPKNILNKFKIENNELLIHKSLLGESDSFKLVNEYYPSGDIIEWIDEPNRIFRFISRKNRLINVGGYKVNPEETEQAILNIDGVIQAVVYGKKNSVLGNVLCAEVQIEEGSNLTETAIRIILNGQLQDFKIPRRIKFVDSFSLTRTGKIKR